MMVHPYQRFILLASVFALFIVQLPSVGGEVSNDALFRAPKGKSDSTCNCANFNDEICRNCYDKVIKCNQACASQCCQLSTFNPDGKKKNQKKKQNKNKGKKKPKPRRKPNSLSYRYRGHMGHAKSMSYSYRYRGHAGRKHGHGHHHSMSHSVRYRGKRHGGSHHISAITSDVELELKKTPEYVHQDSPRDSTGGRGRALRWTSETPKRIRSSS